MTWPQGCATVAITSNSSSFCMQVELNPSVMPKIPGAKVAILQAKWYREPLDRMVQKTVELLVAADCPKPEVHILPGSLELPLAAQTLMRKGVKRWEAL